MPDPPGPSWTCYTLRAGLSLEEELAASLCRAGATGVEVAGISGGGEGASPILKAFFDNADPVPSPEELLEHLARSGLRGIEIEETAQVADGRWVERWIAGLAPFDVGRRFTVIPVVDLDEPARMPEAAGGRIALRICPSRAFGTGEHPTTRLCLEELERIVDSDTSLLDAGTGSGILAIAARLLGAPAVTGVDVDEEAVRVAAQNARLNAVEGIDFRQGTAREWSGGPFSCVVANLNGFILDQSASGLAEQVAPGGRLIVSGILEAESERLSRRFSVLGLRRIGSAGMDGWVCAVHEAVRA